MAENESNSLFSSDEKSLLSSREGDTLFGESGAETSTEDKEKWKVLIVDDEEDIHTVTKMALEDFTYSGKEIVFFSAYSGKEAKEYLQQDSGISLVLLDVVMETNDAGLQVVKFIREELKNRYMQIVLRTGQPGYAPEKEVIFNYDINDYKSKIELTAEKLFSVVMTGLRAYEAIMDVEMHRQQLISDIEQKDQDLERYQAQLKEINEKHERFLADMLAQKKFKDNM